MTADREPHDPARTVTGTPDPAHSSTVHVYDDDLVEEDNQLPRWWLYTLYGAIVFAVLYWFGEQQLKAWAPRDVAFQEESLALKMAKMQNASGRPPPETLIAMSKASATVEVGKQTYVSTCAPCHREDGGGNVGPNLTDDAWLHGSAPENIWTGVHDGFASKGMPAWGAQMGEQKVAAVVAYVMTLKGTNVAGGKAPQGELEPPNKGM